jgi:hypothetical protein
MRTSSVVAIWKVTFGLKKERDMTVHKLPSAEAFDKMDRELEERIEQHGYTFMGVFASETNPAFVYTIGLTEKGVPEVFMSGNFDLHSMQKLAGTVAHELADHALNGTQPVLGVRTELFNMPVELRLVRDENKLNGARRFYGDRVRVIQLIWSDDQGRLPHEAGYDFQKFPQEILPAVQ